MTLIDARNQVIAHFLQKSVFKRQDMGSISVDEDCQELKEPLVETVLNDLAEKGILARLGEKGSESWILSVPFNAAGQQVSLSMATCSKIAEVINTFAKSRGMSDEDQVDSSDISEGHIEALIDIINDVISED